jgi:hypothetical protein
MRYRSQSCLWLRKRPIQFVVLPMSICAAMCYHVWACSKYYAMVTEIRSPSSHSTPARSIELRLAQPRDSDPQIANGNCSLDTTTPSAEQKVHEKRRMDHFRLALYYRMFTSQDNGLIDSCHNRFPE